MLTRIKPKKIYDTKKILSKKNLTKYEMEQHFNCEDMDMYREVILWARSFG